MAAGRIKAKRCGTCTLFGQECGPNGACWLDEHSPVDARSDSQACDAWQGGRTRTVVRRERLRRLKHRAAAGGEGAAP